MEPKTHSLKTWPEYWDAVFSGKKTFEVRKNDRDFHVGDTLELIRWCPTENQIVPWLGGRGAKYTRIVGEIAYILPGGTLGIEYGFCVLGFAIDGARVFN